MTLKKPQVFPSPGRPCTFLLRSDSNVGTVVRVDNPESFIFIRGSLTKQIKGDG